MDALDETVGGCLRLAVRRFASSSIEGLGRIDAEVLLAHVLGWTKTEIHTRITDRVAERERQAFFSLVDRRQEGVPVAYLVGWREFYGRRFWVRPGVLVPRPETELLVEQGLALLRRTPGATKILDLCSGTGCIAVTLALETFVEQIVAVDIDSEALQQIDENVAYYGVAERVTVVESDLFQALGGTRFDLIVSNPPYVGTDFGPRPDPEVVTFEPSVALFSGKDGTDHLKEILERAPAYLIEGGSLIVECACFQAEKVEAWMADRGYAQTQLWHDLSGLPRGVSGRWEGS